MDGEGGDGDDGLFLTQR